MLFRSFNAATGAVAMLTLPLLLLGVGRFRQALGLGAEPAAVVAGFHTLFNLLGVALIILAGLVVWIRHERRDEDD